MNYILISKPISDIKEKQKNQYGPQRCPFFFDKMFLINWNANSCKLLSTIQKKKVADRRIQSPLFIHIEAIIIFVCVHRCRKKKNGASFHNSYLHTKVLLLWFLLYLIKLLCRQKLLQYFIFGTDVCNVVFRLGLLGLKLIITMKI